MIYLFIPYYHEDSDGFRKSLDKQTVPFKTIRRNRKRDKIYWSRACNDFYKDLKKYRGIKDDDVICIMNNDISFPPTFFEEGQKVKEGRVLVPEGININWKFKQFYPHRNPHLSTNAFAGRAFFITAKDFKNSKGFSRLLPHYLSDYEFSIRVLKKCKPILMKQKITHDNHPKEASTFSVLNPGNPIFWTIFLLKCGLNKYFFINLVKIWASGLME